MRTSLHSIALVAFVLLNFSGTAAQSSSEKCPIIVVSCPSKSVWTGTPITFSARIDAANPTAKPEFKWTVSAGRITTGQATSTIVVNTDELFFVPVTATIEVFGVSTTCETRASCSTEVINCGFGMAGKFDEYGALSFEDEKTRLDNFAIQLQNTPGAQGYIFVYGSQQVDPNAVESRLKRAKNYLIKKRGLHPGRIVTQNGGLRNELAVELFIVPVGATPPAPSVTPE
jgi:hypothetical protein